MQDQTCYIVPDAKILMPGSTYARNFVFLALRLMLEGRTAAAVKASKGSTDIPRSHSGLSNSLEHFRPCSTYSSTEICRSLDRHVLMNAKEVPGSLKISLTSLSTPRYMMMRLTMIFVCLSSIHYENSERRVPPYAPCLL